MKRLLFALAAREELDEAVDYYEGQQPGLGSRFAGAVREALDRVLENPSTGILSAKGSRTLRVKRFPYGVVFREYSDYIFIAALCHFSRRENHWADRIADEESS
jgi:toxin ParE1/3/4